MSISSGITAVRSQYIQGRGIHIGVERLRFAPYLLAALALLLLIACESEPEKLVVIRLVEIHQSRQRARSDELQESDGTLRVHCSNIAHAPQSATQRSQINLRFNSI